MNTHVVMEQYGKLSLTDHQIPQFLSTRALSCPVCLTLLCFNCYDDKKNDEQNMKVNMSF